MRSVAFFNNKGGVGKTTLLCNLAAIMGLRLEKRVLIVDADPQCNATQALFSDSIVERLYSKKNSFTIESVIQPLSLGKGYAEVIKPLKCPAFGVEVLPGDPRLALKEDLLANDWKDAISGDPRGLRTTFIFSQLLELCKAYDFVFFDMGPSLGSINRAVLVGCDLFISPMSSDIFSLKAIENISEAMSTWRSDLEFGITRNRFPNEVPLASTASRTIRFAGYVTQQYYAKKSAEGDRRAVSAFEKIMQKIPDAINEYFVQQLQPKMDKLDYNLGTVPNLFSLIPMSQSSRRPIFELRAADGVRGAHFSKVREAGSIFKEIADKFLRNAGLLRQ